MVRKIGIALGVALLAIGGYSWNRERIWTLRDRDGRAVCRVHEGWNEQEVSAHCGVGSGRGLQPKVLASGRGLDVQICSAPGDVYGSKVVFYGCDGRVATVEHMPAHDFVYQCGGRF